MVIGTEVRGKPTRINMDTRKKALGLLAAERIDAIPALRDFAEATAKIGDPSNNGFWAYEDAFQALLKSDVLTALTNHELSKFSADVLYVPLVSFSSQLIILETDAYQLHVGFINARTAKRSTRLQSAPSHNMLSVVTTPIQIAQYLQPEPFPSEDLRRACRLTAQGSQLLTPGAVLKCRAGYDVVEFLPDADTNTLLMSLSATETIPYSWEYDRDTLGPVRFAPGNPTWSRMDYAIKLMGRMGDPKYLPALVRLAEHPAHFVRWSAVCAAVALDFEVGLKLLEQAKSDRHQHVSNAATKAIERFATAQATGAGLPNS